MAEHVQDPHPDASTKAAEYDIRVIGAPRPRVRDFYFYLLRFSWPAMLACIVAIFLLANAAFAALYLWVGGVEGAHLGSFTDAYFFSVQTMGTIGYGAMFPKTFGANVLVVAESVVSLLVTALSTGLIFAKFSRPTARVLFARHATISMMNGKRTLAFRIGNERSNQIVAAKVTVEVGRTEHTAEGKMFYRMTDVPLVRDRITSLARSWLIFHTIDEKSPFWGGSAQVAEEQEMEIIVSVTGIDDTWMQTVHANYRYLHPRIAWDHRPVDVLSEIDGENAVLLDLTKFHEIEPDPHAGAHEANANATAA